MTEQKTTGNSFGNTDWVKVKAAIDSSDARSRLIERYYRPSRAYLLMLTRNSGQADEVVQSFFATELERLAQDGTGGVVRRADPTKGRFRDYLKASLYHHWLGLMRTERGRPNLVRPDDNNAWDRLEVPTHRSAEQSFDKAWIEQLVTEALRKVEAVCQERGQQEHFDLFVAHYLPASGADESWEAIARRFGLPKGKTARNRAQTVAAHFRETIGELLTEEDAGIDLTQEVRELLSILGDDHD